VVSEAGMKRTIQKYGWLGLVIFIAMNLFGCSPVGKVHANQQPVVTIPGAPPEAEISGPSCVNPGPDLALGCKIAAGRILASTVRLEFHGPAGGIGHATVVGGRYLITHNHYPITAGELKNGGDDKVIAVSVLKINGDIILLKAPLSFFSVVGEGPEILVLDFQSYGDVGFFDSVSIPSANLGDVNASLPQPGSEVAQINWDGTIAHVDWVRITAIQNDGGTSYLEIDNFVEQGASGGGVFLTVTTSPTIGRARPIGLNPGKLSGSIASQR
jgi:hypothetical protein